MTPVYNSKGEQVSGFIRPRIRASRKYGPDQEPQLPEEGDGILAIINRKMNSTVPTYKKKPSAPLYVGNNTEMPKVVFKDKPTNHPVNVRLIVTGNGVKVKLDTLSWNIQQEYFAKGKKPPLGLYLRSLSNSGATDAQLEKVVKSYRMWEDDKYLAELDETIQRLWPGSSKSKSKNTQPRKILKAVKKI